MRLKSKDLKPTRDSLVASQGHSCDLCGEPIVEDDRVHLDHNHDTGAVRGALHGQCNLMLGYIEGWKGKALRNREAWLRGVWPYLQKHAENQTGLLHPTHLTADEKKIKAKKRAKKRKLSSPQA